MAAVNIPIALWISYAKIWQYLKGNIIAKQRIFGGGPIVPDYEEVLRWVRLSVEWAFGQNPNDPTLNVTGTYMISLVNVARAKIVAAGGVCIPPVILISPVSQTINSGGTATFFVGAAGSGTLTYQWQLNLTNISGATSATYTTPSVTTGGSYRCIVSNACGNAVSGTATLTVNAPAISFTIGWSATDPFVNNTTPLNITNSLVVSYTPGANIVFNGALALFANTFIMWAWPATEPTPNVWSNGDPSTALNKGVIPDFTMRDVFTIGATKYACCRNPMVLDTSLDLRLIH